MPTGWRIVLAATLVVAAAVAWADPAAADGPTEVGVVTGAAEPDREASPTRPAFQLPWRWDVLWQAGSPHDTNGSALDFGPRRVEPGNDDVVASAAGTVQRVTCSGGSYPRIDHGNGWVSSYYHVVNVDWRLVGRRVLAGTRLGDAGNATPCGGRSTFPHVHFEVSHHGRPVNLDGISMGGYTVHSAGRPYSGHWTDDGSGAVVVRNPDEARCCLRSTTRAFVVPDQGALADVDGDGRDDVVHRRSATVSISTDSSVRGGDPEPEHRLTWGRNTDQLYLGDVTGDGRADLVFRRGPAYFVEHDLLQPGGDPRNDRRFTWGRGTDELFLADVDGDGRDDFVVRNGTTVAVNTDAAVPGGDPATAIRFTLGQAGDGLHLGDVTGDGRADFILKRGATYLVDHDGTPGVDQTFTWGRPGSRLHVGDVDGDGRHDLVLRTGNAVAISTDTAVPGGDHQAEQSFTRGLATDLVHLGDVTGDGRDDLVLRRGRRYFVNDDRSFAAGRPHDQLIVRPTVP